MTVVLCACECGQPAPIATRTRTEWGHIKGQPIRIIRASSDTQKVLAARYGVCPATIAHVRSGRNWRGV